MFEEEGAKLFSVVYVKPPQVSTDKIQLAHTEIQENQFKQKDKVFLCWLVGFIANIVNHWNRLTEQTVLCLSL